MDFSTLTYKYTQSILKIRNELQSEIILNCPSKNLAGKTAGNTASITASITAGITTGNFVLPTVYCQ